MSDRLIDRWVSGLASAEDRAELCELLDKDPALVDRLFRAAERECDLAEFFRGITPISSTPVAPTRTNRFRRPPSASWWLPFSSGLAAALLVTVLTFHLAGQRSNEPSSASVVKDTPLLVPNLSVPPPQVEQPTPAPLVAEDHTTLELFFAELPNDSLENTPKAPPEPSLPTTVAVTKPVAPVMVAKRQKTSTEGQRIDRLDGELKDGDDNLVMRYSLRVPHVLPSRPELGLVLCFHGAGGNEQWLADPILTALRGQGDVQMVVAALKSKGPNWTSGDEANVLAFIEWAKRTYPIDLRRIVIQGVSNGGWMVSHFGSRHPELVAGVVTVCGGNGFEAPVKRPVNAAETGFEYYVVHGTADEDVNIKHARGITATLRANGFRYVYRELPGVGHEVFNDVATRNDLAGWLTRLRHKTMPLPEEHRKALAAFTTRDEAERLLLTDEGAQTLVRIGGLPAEKVMVRALRSKNPLVRATVARLFSHTATMPGAASLLAGLLDDKDAGVRDAVITSLLRAADWNDQDALIALCRFAGGKEHTPGDRLDVVQALTASQAFRSSPGRDNQLIYELLVHLLEDDDVALRAAAIGAFPHVEPERFAYEPDATLSDRREAVSQWRRWYRDLFAPTDEKPDARR